MNLLFKKHSTQPTTKTTKLIPRQCPLRMQSPDWGHSPKSQLLQRGRDHVPHVHRSRNWVRSSTRWLLHGASRHLGQNRC